MPNMVSLDPIFIIFGIILDVGAWSSYHDRSILKSWSLDPHIKIAGIIRSYSEKNWTRFRRSRPILYLGSLRVGICWQWSRTDSGHFVVTA